jgi:hypothetical protein
LSALAGRVNLIHMADAVDGQRIGSALRGLAEDLVAERRRVLFLRRENRELREELAARGVDVNGRFGARPEGEAKADPGGADLCPLCGQPLPDGGARFA